MQGAESEKKAATGLETTRPVSVEANQSHRGEARHRRKRELLKSHREARLLQVAKTIGEDKTWLPVSPPLLFCKELC